MQKSLLSAVALWSTQDNAATELYRHTFEYNKAPATTAIFSSRVGVGAVVKAGTAGTVPRTEKGLSNTSDHLGGKDVSLGVGFPLISATGTYGNDLRAPRRRISRSSASPAKGCRTRSTTAGR